MAIDRRLSEPKEVEERKTTAEERKMVAEMEEKRRKMAKEMEEERRKERRKMAKEMEEERRKMEKKMAEEEEKRRKEMEEKMAEEEEKRRKKMAEEEEKRRKEMEEKMAEEEEKMAEEMEEKRRKMAKEMEEEERRKMRGEKKTVKTEGEMSGEYILSSLVRCYFLVPLQILIHPTAAYPPYPWFSRIELQCQSNKRDANYRWFINNREEPSLCDSSICVHLTNMGYVGKYHCVVEYNGERRTSKSTKVDVKKRQEVSYVIMAWFCYAIVFICSLPLLL